MQMLYWLLFYHVQQVAKVANERGIHTSFPISNRRLEGFSDFVNNNEWGILTVYTT